MTQPHRMCVKERMMDRTRYKLLETYMLQCMEDSAHDREHVYRVLYAALLIAGQEENVDMDVLICACLLHDIGRAEQFANPKLCHAEVGGEKAYRFLLENGFDERYADHVRDCIVSHRFRQNRQPQTIEAKILFDADKLDAAGAMGVARTLLYQGYVGEPLYHISNDGRLLDGEEDISHSFFHEYKFKLEKLYDRFYTNYGKELAAQREKSAIRFYHALLQEARQTHEGGSSILQVLLREREE